MDITEHEQEQLQRGHRGVDEATAQFHAAEHDEMARAELVDALRSQARTLEATAVTLTQRAGAGAPDWQAAALTHSSRYRDAEAAHVEQGGTLTTGVTIP